MQFGICFKKNVIQGTDTTATFAPYIQLAANEQLSRVVVSSKSFPYGVPGKIVNYYFWESNVQQNEFTARPEVENYTISVTNTGVRLLPILSQWV